MDGLKIYLGFQAIVIGISLIIIAILIFKRIKKKKKETFEVRDN
jgi:multisubunit Na+/H+ antiporter MnhB subunit